MVVIFFVGTAGSITNNYEGLSGPRYSWDGVTLLDPDGDQINIQYAVLVSASSPAAAASPAAAPPAPKPAAKPAAIRQPRP